MLVLAARHAGYSDATWETPRATPRPISSEVAGRTKGSSHPVLAPIPLTAKKEA